MRQILNLQISENSTRCTNEKIFKFQEIEVIMKEDTLNRSIDGRVTKGSHPSEIHWFGGDVSVLQGVTNIKITDKIGTILIDGALNTYLGIPKICGEFIKFYVL
jgi:hypothetical protein